VVIGQSAAAQLNSSFHTTHNMANHTTTAPTLGSALFADDGTEVVEGDVAHWMRQQVAVEVVCRDADSLSLSYVADTSMFLHLAQDQIKRSQCIDHSGMHVHQCASMVAISTLM
jgi:hypothetical protein